MYFVVFQVKHKIAQCFQPCHHTASVLSAGCYSAMTHYIKLSFKRLHFIFLVLLLLIYSPADARQRQESFPHSAVFHCSCTTEQKVRHCRKVSVKQDHSAHNGAIALILLAISVFEIYTVVLQKTNLLLFTRKLHSGEDSCFIFN